MVSASFLLKKVMTARRYKMASELRRTLIPNEPLETFKKKKSLLKKGLVAKNSFLLCVTHRLGQQ